MMMLRKATSRPSIFSVAPVLLSLLAGLAPLPLAAQQPTPEQMQQLQAQQLQAQQMKGMQRLRVAVMVFDVGQGVQDKASREFSIQQDLGRKLSDLLIDRLVNDGRVIVIERDQLDKILKEQNISNSDRNDPSTAAKIGKIAGVDAMIIGAVTAFSSEQTESKTGAIARTGGKWLGGLSGTQLDQKNMKVIVATTSRIVSVNTAEILASATGMGQADKKQSGLGGGSTGLFGAGTSTTSTGNPLQPLAEQATLQAISTMAAQLEANPSLAPHAAPPPPPAAKVVYTGLVADVTGNAIILNVGSKSGVRVGDTVTISRPVRTVKDPTTGKVLKVVSDNLGDAKITEVDEASATATYSGTAPLKVNDHVSSSSTP